MTDKTNYEELNYIEQRVASAAPNIFIAYAIWFFLGFLGIHRMFLGQSKGVIMLIVTIVSYFTLIFFIGAIGLTVMLVWWIYDAIQIPRWINEKKDALRMKIKAEL